MNKIDRMKQLIELIDKYNYAYYTLDNPLISDKEYDDLYYELVSLEKETGTILDNSPTQKVGDVVLDKFEKVKHEQKLYSLNKANNYEELKTWFYDMKNAGATKFSLEYKYDGLRVVLKYENGILKNGATRGNGLVGENITEQIKTIKNIPKTINFRKKLIVMGEVLMKLSVLEKYNKNSNEPLKNARNAAAGALRNLDTKVTASRNLDAIIYDIQYIDDKITSQTMAHEFLKNQNFDTFDYFYTLDSFSEIVKHIDEVDKIKNTLDILIDGMVIKVDDYNIREKVGFTEKFPKWAIAYKFEAQELTSIVKNVVWQVGRTGKLTPVCEIEPIELAGATVTHATLNNYDDIKRKDVAIGSRVFVRRSNEVIPEILGVAEHLQNSKKIDLPTICPCCKTKLIYDDINLFCPNDNCPERIVAKITHFASKNAMNIEGLSEKTVNLLYNTLNITKVTQLYELTSNDLSVLEGFKSKKINNLLQSIEKSKNVELSNFIYALGINGVGQKTAKDIAKKFGSIENVETASIDDLLEIKDIGDIIAKNIVDFFNNKNNIDLIEDLIKLGVTVLSSNKINNINNMFFGKTVVITGTLKNFSREEATKLLENFGSNVTNSISSKTDYLLCGENPGSKLTKAKNLGVNVIGEDIFMLELNKHK